MRSLSAGRAGRVLDGAMCALVAVAGFVASLPALRAFQAGGTVPALALAAGLPFLIALPCARFLRWPAAASYAISLAGLVVLLVASGGFRIEVTYRDLVNGPNRILTETLPLGGGLAALAPLLVLTWVAGAAAAELLARAPAGRPPPRLPLAIPVGVFLVCYGVAVDAPHRDDGAGPVLLLLLAAAAVVRNHRSSGPALPAGDGTRAERRFRPFAVGLVSAGIATAVLWAVAPEVPALTARPAAVHRTPPTVRPVVTDPVEAVAQLRDGSSSSPARPLLTVDISGPSTGYLALAVLDAYDGGLWQFGATFQPTGGRIPVPSGLFMNKEVTQRVTELSPLPVPVLPALDRPVFVSGVPVATDPSTGMLIPQSAGTEPTSYTVVSQAPGASLAELPAVDQLGGSPSPADLALPPGSAPDIATTARFLAALTGARPSPTISFLDAMMGALRANTRRIDPQLAPPGQSTPSHLGGTSLSEVINAVTVNRAATPEQFATFCAMVARYLGVPARVVTGFRIGGSSSNPSVAAGRYEITAQQAWAWVEVPVAGIGWVVMDPTPDRVTGVATPPPESVQAPSTTLPPRQANVVPNASILGGHPLAPSARIHLPRHDHAPMWLVVVLVAGGGMLAVLLAGPGQAGARRWWRRRSRRSDDPAELAVGAWLELLDGLARAGLQPEPGSTTREVAAEAAGSLGPDLMEPIGEVGVVAEQAVFSLSTPPDPEAARHAWDVQRTLCRQVRKGLAPAERLRASLLVGSTPRRPAGR